MPFALSWFSFMPLFYVLITHSENKLRFAFGRGFLFGLYIIFVSITGFYGFIRLIMRTLQKVHQ